MIASACPGTERSVAISSIAPANRAGRSGATTSASVSPSTDRPPSTAATIDQLLDHAGCADDEYFHGSFWRSVGAVSLQVQPSDRIMA